MEKHRRFHSRVYPLMEAEAENTDLNRIILKGGERTESSSESGSGSGSELGRIGIISSGFTSSIVEKILKKRAIYREISHLSLNLVNPLPLGKIGTFLRSNQRVLVIEESEPFIEEQIRIAGRVYGKKTGHLPYGQVMPEDMEFALKHINEEEVSRPADTAFLKSRNKGRATICDNCPYLPLYQFLSSLDVRVAGDMGCSVRSAPEPLAAVDVSFALGSAISVACGFEKKGIAVIGDFALAHSGILGLLSAATAGCDVLIFVLQNEVAAMTEGQEVPDLRKVVEAITPDVSAFDMDIYEGEVADKIETEKETGHKIEKQVFNPELSEMIRAKLALPGISVIYLKGKCRKY
jgi:indolepyruvate ferredoxin oxidoreductase alpha subunit